MRRTILALIAICVLNLDAQEILQRFDWDENSKTGRAGLDLAGSVEQGFLRVESTNSAGLRAALLRIENPPISQMFYAVRGQIRYEGVEGDGFLEMWSVFPPTKEGAAEGQFFSRTLGLSGEMGKISGTSGLRAFTLPFDRTGLATTPTDWN